MGEGLHIGRGVNLGEFFFLGRFAFNNFINNEQLDIYLKRKAEKEVK